MHALTPPQLAHLQAALSARLQALLVTHGPALSSTDPNEHDLPISDIETAPADKATVRLMNDLALEAAGHQHILASSLRHALAKIEAGNYGVCEQCGQDIGFSRLHARPEARLCIACQTRLEAR
jgi:DnaK suppressor protein